MCSKPSKLSEIIAPYQHDLSSPELLEKEMCRWKSKYSTVPADKLPNSPSDAIKECDAKLYPNIRILLQIACTLPVTSCKCERTASVLRRLKTYMRATMDMDKVIDMYAQMHPTRIELQTLLICTSQLENLRTGLNHTFNALDLVPDRRPNKNPKLGGYLGCSACWGTFLFYDRLRHVAVAKLDQDPTRLAEIADVLLSIYQCERRTFRYMAHVMLAAQQSHRMKQVITEMDSSTAYVVVDFRQKFLAKGFREGGDSYYGKKDDANDVQEDEDLPEGEQDEDVPEGKQDEDVPEGKQDEDVPEGKQDEDVPEGKQDEQDEDVPEGEQDEDVPEGEQDEDVPEGEQDENGGDEDAQADVQDEDLQEEGDEEDGTPALHFIDYIVQGEQRADGNVVLSSDSEGTCVQKRKDRRRYTKRSKGMSKREIQHLQKWREDEEALKRIRAVYPQCAECLNHFKSHQLLVKHVCGGVVMSHDVLSNAMKHADQLLSRMDFSVEGAIDRALSMFDTEVMYATFESNCYSGWAHTRKCMHPELTSNVNSIIHQCWKDGESIELGKVKISIDGVFARLDEMQLQKVIRLSELPLAGKIRVVYQSIGSKPEAP
eukprot:Em0007g597a